MRAFFWRPPRFFRMSSPSRTLGTAFPCGLGPRELQENRFLFSLKSIKNCLQTPKTGGGGVEGGEGGLISLAPGRCKLVGLVLATQRCSDGVIEIVPRPNVVHHGASPCCVDSNYSKFVIFQGGENEMKSLSSHFPGKVRKKSSGFSSNLGHTKPMLRPFLLRHSSKSSKAVQGLLPSEKKSPQQLRPNKIFGLGHIFGCQAHLDPDKRLSLPVPLICSVVDCGSKIGAQNGALANRTKDQNPRSPGGLLLTHHLFRRVWVTKPPTLWGPRPGTLNYIHQVGGRHHGPHELQHVPGPAHPNRPIRNRTAPPRRERPKKERGAKLLLRLERPICGGPSFLDTQNLLSVFPCKWRSGVANCPLIFLCTRCAGNILKLRSEALELIISWEVVRKRSGKQIWHAPVQQPNSNAWEPENAAHSMCSCPIPLLASPGQKQTNFHLTKIAQTFKTTTEGS